MNEEDLVVLVERFIDCKAALFGDRRPTEVTCGYYFTRQNNLNFIRLHGLQPEQMAPGICEQGRGVHFGDGIYTSRNPEAFQGSCSDSVGLLVAIVKGKETNVTGPEPPIPDVDTVVGNMVIPQTEDSEQLGGLDECTFHDEVVLRQSAQCLPLFSFVKNGPWTYDIDGGCDNDLENIWTCHERLQGVMDLFFNEGRMVPVIRQKKPHAASQQAIESQLLARRIQQREDREAESVAMMMISPAGCAWKLVEEILFLHDELMTLDGMTNLSLAPIATDDIVFLAERFIECRMDFGTDGRPTDVTCGYHYTNQNNLDAIRQDGLLSRPERVARNVGQQTGGAYFGDGIYTGRNPQAFQNFGNVGLLVAILKGNERNVRNAEPPNPAINTVIGNKVFPKTEGHGSGRNLDDKKTYNDEVVLRTSSQCLPLFSFSMRRYTYDNGQNKDWDNIWTCHERLQGVLDRFFNEGRTLSVHRQRN
mmetsp:Transcript_18956/g.32470  ORF Transcript_18956/g.32470 Transcript_18956/m.32470 type:complete len:476 (-) Transcript_18956:230-1657(-)